MNFKELTLKLCEACIEHPVKETITIDRKTGEELFDLLKLLNWYFGPSMTEQELHKMWE